ncbi:Eukaryotic translation initiation factor 2-alpha kinase 1 [Larimichthys crocea]|uniref:Uncharacterized protein n=1 Tax=Larimichthys crocea TaxID=215358 RepID=A0ACD3RRM4_LARCR|nr:Eukaryotic translation initiation factor 2-alpha kinase 1 [Larimichthys crocea]
MDLGDRNIVEMIAKVIEEASDTDDNREVLMAGRHYVSIQEFASAIPNHLLLGSLLEHLCFVYESNPARSRTLFKVIGQRLAAMNLLSPLAISDEFSTVRLQHNRAFTELLHAASSSLYPQVMNKLDGQCYAVKKILIKKVSKDDCMKDPKTLLPALESPEEQESSIESPDSSSSSSSIVFQSLSEVASAKVPSRDTQPVKALVPAQEKGQVVCPKTMRRIPTNYVPCVFLGQRDPAKGSKCPATGLDSSALLEEESSRSSIELNNNFCIDGEYPQWGDIHTTKPVYRGTVPPDALHPDAAV